MQTRHYTLIASPDLSFGELRGRLTELGWDMESASEKPILEGEPELAVFVHRTEDTRIHYTYNPVVHLRVLQFRGPRAESWHLKVAGGISALGAKDLHRLLDSIDLKHLLLGLFAAEELSEIEVIEQVARLCLNADARVARTAVRVRDSLLSGAVGRVATQLVEEQTQHPERSVWFAHLSQPELRKQVLRWLMRDFATSNASIDQTLRSALADSDPEVRITAVLATARLNAKNAGPALREAAIPTSTSEGADRRDRFFFERLRQTALRYLATESVAPNSKNHEGKREQFRKAIHGELEVRDDPTLLLHALITPLEPAEPPKRLPEEVENRDESYFLKRSGLALRWVPPVPHWLGEDPTGAPEPQNPIRRVTPNNGFFIAEIPLTTAMVFWSSEPDTEPPAAGNKNDASPFLCTYDVATHLCEVFSHLERASLHLPSADQWEMAARGPDGRRYPWGNCFRQDGQLAASPWGMKKGPQNVYEWTGDVGPAGSRIVCGGQATAPCAARHAVSAADAAAQGSLRFILEGEPD